jgi:hypothetical protein
MDTVRSEYSEGSLTSSRLDDGSATGRASLSFSMSNSHASRLSIDSGSTRSDYLSNFERKFRERKAAKHKKSEKAKREKEKADRQELFSADQRRKAEREAERQARRREMETWLTDPNELRRIERRSQKRSRDRMRTLKEWYVPATSASTEEVQPVFVAALAQQSNQEHSNRKKVIKPLLSKEAAALRDEEDREALEQGLQRQLTAFTAKLEYLEQCAEPPTRAKTRAGPSRRRRRIAREDLLLAPLGPASSNLQAARSVATLPSYHASKALSTLTTSTSLQTLRPKPRLPLDTEGVEDVFDDAEVDEYLLRHRKVAKQSYAAVKLQATWRMHLRRRKYLPWRQRRTRHRRAVFEIWVMTYRVGTRAQRSLLRKYFSAWRVDVVETLQLREMELQLFRQAATQTELPRMVLNLVFTSDWEDERAKRMAAKATDAAKKKEIAPTSKAAFLHAFLNSAFGDVESASDKNRRRVHHLRAQHIAAREEVRKKVAQHVFLLWKKVHEANKRVGLNAQLCLKRAVRMAFGTRQRWPAEILLSVFDIWARWATFSRCKRLGLPLPRFAEPNPQWDIWLHNYQERQVRRVKAASKAPGARLRRFFLRLHAFARRAVRERSALALAAEHFSHNLRHRALLEWREAIADSAAEKKLARGVMLRLHRYASAKRKLRPLKEVLRKRQREWFAHRVWRGWKRVQLHACFKRELNLARLENSQAWRSRLHRTLDMWRDERDSLRLSRTFEGWVHCVRKRKLFLTLRLLCARQQRRHLLFSVFHAWKAAKWDRFDGFLEDRLRLDAWDAYRELSVFFPMMFYGSFSDAGSIFGGLPSHLYGESGALQRLKQDPQELLLSTCGDAVRHFHGVLVRESIVEVRNAILQTRHLINAVDSASGNTALHVAAQIEEPERRQEIVTLLLSEGAATLKRKNRHGLSPGQLALDAETRLLLDDGIFAFHSRDVLKRDVGDERSNRLLWCMVALMTREWGIGLRIPADVRVGQWHSTLREELWLRQKQIRFSPDSTFAPAVRRSRGFLNALKTRLCVSHNDLLHAACRHKSKRSEDSAETRERRYQEWEARSKARIARAREAGEYEAYARYLLAPTLDTEACEQELIPSFVGLLFTLDFSVDEVLEHAYRLEDECTAAEGELWELYLRIQRAERDWRVVFYPGLQETDAATRTDVGMLRLFSDDADADLFFRKELFLLEFEHFSSRERDVRDDGVDVQQEALALEIDTLLIRVKRKLRKAEKKAKRVQDQIEEAERAYREALFASSRRVEDISVARRSLEHARVRMAMASVKLKEVQVVVARLQHAKQVLQSDALPTKRSVESPPNALSACALPFHEQKALLGREKARYSHMFQARVVMEQAQEAANASVDPGTKQNVVELPEALHPLQKEAVAKLHALFVLNLFRSCCCWLGENMVAMEDANKAASLAGSEGDASGDEQAPVAVNAGRAESNSVGLARLLSAAGDLFAEGMSRRRSSLKNTRRVLETYHRGCTMRDLLDPDNEAMHATYAASAALLFEEERQAVQRSEQERLSIIKKVDQIAAISERNPVTGDLEVAPEHVVDIDAIPASARRAPVVVVEPNAVPRNRKKEELERAMRHQRPQRPDSSESDSDDSVGSQPSKLLPVIHGAQLHFGNFVAGHGGDEMAYDHELLHQLARLDPRPHDAAAAASTDAMWKRGGVKLADGTAPSIREVLAHAHRLSTSREKLRPGSRRQGVCMAPEVPAPQQVAPAGSPTSPAPPAAEPTASSRTGSSSPVHDAEKPQRRLSRPLGRASSMSSLLPASTALTLTASSQLAEPELNDISRREDNGPKLPRVQETPEQLTLPAVQINVRSRQNSASSSRTSRTSSRREDTSSDPASLGGTLSQDVVRYSAHEPTCDELDPNDHEAGAAMSKASTTGPVEVDVPPLSLQSPAVDVTTSRPPDLQGEGRAAQPLLGRWGDAVSLGNDAAASTTTPFIKWEEGAALEAFPLAVVATTRPGSVVQGVRRDSTPKEEDVSMVRIGSLREPKETPGEEIDELVATRFRLDDGDIPSGDGFSLQGKSLAMAAKCSGKPQPRAKDPCEKRRPDERQKARTTQSSSSAATLRPTPAITVTVVTKPAKQEVDVVEYVKPKAAAERPRVEPLLLEPPKPFVKLESDPDASQVLPPGLQLEVMGLNRSLSSLPPRGDTRAAKEGQDPKREQGKPLVRVRQSRDRAPPTPTPISPQDLSLQGARMLSKNTDTEARVRQLEVAEMGDVQPLTKAQKEQLWRDFVATPLSTPVQEGYTILYPQTYSNSATATKRVVQAAPTANALGSYSPTPTEPPPWSHAPLRVDTTREPAQKALDQNRRFWSAVEGYHAIGSSSLIPLDAATVAQRRKAKAEAIFDQFFRGQRDQAGSGESRGLSLPWIDMYAKEVADVRRQLPHAPKALFDELQRAAELQISTALAKRNGEEAGVVPESSSLHNGS